MVMQDLKTMASDCVAEIAQANSIKPITTTTTTNFESQNKSINVKDDC